MGWGLNDRACQEAVKAKYVKCKGCEHCRPIDDARNRCARRDGVFWTRAPHLCGDHPTTQWREKVIEELKRNKKGG